ncbi:nucleoprotein TPR [Musca vetustissima]|uniref:nucleoprotein TPR n=1 Tax=Musca vetustissima TaxID=27455 RepID=UPI002AB642A9|nr:nucleoprotein TPR [Musca vetustissima]
MASNESTETELNSPPPQPQPTTPTTTAMPSENIGEEISEVVEASNQRRRSAAYRGVHFASVPEENEDDVEQEDLWWREVENAEFTLDHVPHVTSVFTPSPEDILEQPTSPEETLNAIYDEEFERLHRIATRIKNTMEEQRVRHFSESSQDNDTQLKVEAEEVLQTPSTTAGATANKEQSLDEFKEELRLKRLTRQSAIQGLRDEISLLRKQLERERDISRRLRNGEQVEESPPLDLEEEKKSSKSLAGLEGATALPKNCSSELLDDNDDENPMARSRHANIELANAQLALQMANSENLSLRGELDIVQKQVASLKDVIACCKQMLTVKEEQCNELKQRLSEIEKSFAEHEMKIMSDNLRQEYERQLVNIRQLKQLYEERQRVAAAEYENLQRLISIKRDELGQEQEKTKALEERNKDMVREIELANNELACLRDECKEHRFEKAALKEEMGAVNTLFSQMVMGFNGKNNLDIDRLTTMLEENRTLLNDMATKECTDGATLPKLLFELVEQASVKDTTGMNEDERANALCRQVSKEMTHKENATANEETKIVSEDNSSCSSQDEEDGEENDEVDNENMILASNSEQTVTSASEQQQQPENIDNTDAAVVAGSAASATASSDVAFATNEKVSGITLQQTKSKKQHHSHHRKSSNNIKKSTNTTTAAGGSGSATLKFNDPSVMAKVASTQEIIGNLPKVWRVLVELLNHHHIDPVKFEENGKGEDCYKSVQTPYGPKAELSVSKTYLKLKDLILEKKSLVKETNRLKTLNSHLDYRLNEQEKRLSTVSLELTKTWHLVGKMQRQHRQMHTQEQILRYQLQQKRRLLHELKDELEYCRRKWQAARAKNDESQEQCDDLRREFARRKLEDANNSAESGYSDSGGPVSDEEDDVDAATGIAMEKEDVEVNVEDDDDAMASTSTGAASGGCVNYRRKRLREMFEHSRKIKRMQSTSPGRANANPNNTSNDTEEVVLRWNSAPPTCGWRKVGEGEDNDDDDEEEDEDEELEMATILVRPSTSASGAIPKSSSARSSRRSQRRSVERSNATDLPDVDEPASNPESVDDRATRIKRLEEQCKTLIQQVLETSDNRERLEVQLRRFQDEMAPVQYAVPLEELMNKKRKDRTTRASSAPASGTLTPREEEYTRRRSERLGRLEEESRQLLFRIKRTSDRGHYLRCSLDRIRRNPVSREGSFESNTEEEGRKSEDEASVNAKTNENASKQSANLQDGPSTSAQSMKSPLSAQEEAYTARRAARLHRLEEESRQLLTKLSHNNNRGDSLGLRLDILHERHGSQEEPTATAASSSTTTNSTSKIPVAGKLTTEQRIENIEKISSNREQRLRILEEEGRQLINRLSETSEKGTQMINRIAERELNRQQRSNSTPQRDNADLPSTSTAVVDPLLPTLKNVACSSIVSDELTERVTITTTPSQIAAHQGAIPKTTTTTTKPVSKPTTQLLAARSKSDRLQSITQRKPEETKEESLEEMVKRLQSLPFPKTEEEKKEEEATTVGHPAEVKEDTIPSPPENENKLEPLQEPTMATMEESSDNAATSNATAPAAADPATGITNPNPNDNI